MALTAAQLRDEALLMLQGRGANLDVARAVTRVLIKANVGGAVIGGIDVTLHGHVRATSDGVRTASLADLINLKLRSGTRNLLRAQDLGDVINLIRHHSLDGRFAARIAKPLREEFRRLARAVRADRDRPPPADPFSQSGEGPQWARHSEPCWESLAWRPQSAASDVSRLHPT